MEITTKQKRANILRIVITMLVLFNLPLITAFEFDNVVSDTNDFPTAIIKDPISKEYIWEKYPNQKITNLYGLGQDLEIFSLYDHDFECESNCYSLIAVNHQADNTPLIDSIDFYKINKGTRTPVSLDYKVMIKTGEIEHNIPEYTEVCEELTDKNGTKYQECSPVESGSHKVIEDVFSNYDLKEPLPQGEYLIKIEGQKLPKDSIDWILTSQGKELVKWAVWGSSNMTKDLQAYWTFNDSSTKYIDSVSGNYNLSITPNVKGGVINNSFGANNQGYQTTLTPQAVWQGITLNFWVNKTGAWSIYSPIAYLSDAATPNANGKFYLRDDTDGGDNNLVYSVRDSVSQKVGTSPDLNDNQWYMITFMINSTDVTLYVNGTYHTRSALSSFSLSSGQALKMFIDPTSNKMLNANFDEFGVWNRTLTPTEITTLYNSHQGKAYPFANSVILEAPRNNGKVNANNVTFNASISMLDSTIKNVSLWINSTGTFRRNQTKTYTGTNNLSIFSLNLSDGNYIWNVEVCANDDTCGFALSNYSFMVDATKPVINVFSPTNALSGALGSAIDLNYSVTDVNPSSCWYEYNGINTTLSNCLNSSFTLALSNELRLYANDSVGNTNYSFVNWTIGYLSNNIYENITYDTKRETFILNLTYNPSMISNMLAVLYYNGVAYSPVKIYSDSSTMTFSKALDIPLVSSASNFSFYWTITTIDNSGSLTNSNTQVRNQTVLPSIIALCNSTYPTMGINFTIWNETGSNMINGTFKSTFRYYLGSGSVVKNVSFNLPLNSSFKFCVSPNQTFTLKSVSSIKSSGFLDRTFSFIDSVNNTPSERKLYLLSTTEGRNIILSFKDVGLRGLYGYYMEINRYYPELNGYVAVHQDLTDNFGTVVGSLIENSVKYKFKFYDTNYTLVKTTNDVSIACRSTICTLDFVYDTPINDFDRFNNITNYDYSLIFNNDTSTFIYSWNDNTGATPFHRLVVEKIGYNGTIIVCNSSSTALVGSLSCAVTADGSYSAQAFRSASPERRVFILNKKIGLENDAGREGLIWSFILTMTMIGVGMYNPAVGIGLYLFVFIVLGTIGILYVNPVILIAEIVMGVAFIWAFRS